MPRSHPYKFTLFKDMLQFSFILKDLDATETYAWVSLPEGRRSTERRSALESSMKSSKHPNLYMDQAEEVKKLTSTVACKEIQRLLALRKLDIEHNWTTEEARARYHPQDESHVGDDVELYAFRDTLDAIQVKVDSLLGDIRSGSARTISENTERSIIAAAMTSGRCSIHSSSSSSERGNNNQREQISGKKRSRDASERTARQKPNQSDHEIEEMITVLLRRELTKELERETPPDTSSGDT